MASLDLLRAEASLVMVRRSADHGAGMCFLTNRGNYVITAGAVSMAYDSGRQAITIPLRAVFPGWWLPELCKEPRAPIPQ